MKKRNRTVLMLLAVLLLVSSLASFAEAASGYTVNTTKHDLFGEIPERPYDVYAVTEYDSEHFARFTDPETGFWGVGLKKEFYPYREPAEEGAAFTYENAAVILLEDAGYDYAAEEYYDIKITLDRITFAAMAAGTFREEADLAGVFGYSRGMETIGFLSGWGVRALRGEDGNILKTGDIWKAEDDAGHDAALQCTETEFTVTAVSKAGTPIRPSSLAGFYWTAADLDTLQAEGSAEGENGFAYEAGYFDETLKLLEGFSLGYTVQKENFLDIRSEEYENDCIAAGGTGTGENGQPEKRFTSVKLSQKEKSARALWRGCSTESEAARTELFFTSGVKKTEYTVRYVDKETREEIAGPKKETGKRIGSSATEEAPSAIGDYLLASEAKQTIKLKADGKKNVIVFEYEAAGTSYTVRYLEEGTENELAEPKTVNNQAVGEEVTEDAIGIENYDLVSESPVSITLGRDAAENVITFYYKKALQAPPAITDYEVRYLEEGTEKQLAEPKTVNNQAVGEEVTEGAIGIENYDLVSESPVSITLGRDAAGNVITFYYKKALTDYEVRYLEQGTDKELAPAKTVKGEVVGEEVTEDAIGIENYDLVSESPVSITLGRDAAGNVIKFYYKRAVADYTVYYLEEGTDRALANPKTVNNQAVGKEVTEDAIGIENYDLVSESSVSITLVRNTAENVIKFHYKRAVADYTVKYLEQGTDKELAPAKTVKGEVVGEEVTEDAIGIENYDLVSGSSQTITLERDSARNEIIFYYQQAVTEYTVKYLEQGTDKELAPAKTVTDQVVGNKATEDAIGIENYDLVSGSSKTITLERDSARNEIIFYYQQAVTEYTVYYLEKDTDRDLAEPKCVTDQAVGSTVTENAMSIENYKLVSSSSQSITLAENGDANVIMFYYEWPKTSITVYYQDYYTHENIADPEVTENVPVGVPVIVRFKKFEYYSITGASSKRITPKPDPAQNEVIFYYAMPN